MAKFCCVCLGVEERVTEFVKSDYKRFIEKIFLENGYHQILYEKCYVCYECKALLEKTYKFVQKALTAQNILNDLWKNTSEITLDNLNAINRKYLGLSTKLSKQGPFFISCFTEDEKEGKKETVLEVNDDEKEPPDVIDELHENEIIVELKDFDDVDPFDNIKVEREDVRIKNNPDVTSDTASRNDIADNELKKSHDTEHSVQITIDDSISVDDSNTVVLDEITSNETKINKIAKQLEQDPDYVPELLGTEKPKRKRKTTSSHPPQTKEKKVRLKWRDYKPSAFMLSLSTIAEQKRRRNTKKYDSDDSGDKKDDEFNPASPNSSENDSEDSMYDKYDDSGRRLKKPDDRVYPMPCDHCNAEIPVKREHYRHYMTHHPKIEYPYQKPKLQNLLCQFCGFVSNRKELHVAHELTHSSERAFPCNKCPKRFKNRIHLLRHKNTTHSNVVLECDYCGKKAKIKSDLALHIRTHTGEKPYKCHICGAGFAHNGNVGIHIRYKHQGLSQKPNKTRKEYKTKRERVRKTRPYSSTDEEEPLINMKKGKVKKAKSERNKTKK